MLVKTEDHSRSSLINVFGEQPRFVWIQKEGLEVEVPAASLPSLRRFRLAMWWWFMQAEPFLWTEGL